MGCSRVEGVRPPDETLPQDHEQDDRTVLELGADQGVEHLGPKPRRAKAEVRLKPDRNVGEHERAVGRAA
jgi:hypothetical protein